MAAAPKVQWLWDVRYIDAPVLRWRDTGGDPDLDEALVFCNDANMNVTALEGAAGGTVVERYAYDPYGKPTFLEPDWDPTQLGQEPPGTLSAYANDVLYAGYRWDPETGLYHVRHRSYHPTLGRWIARDREPYADGPSLYLYARGTCTGVLDPLGLYGQDFHQRVTRDLAEAAGLCFAADYGRWANQPDVDYDASRIGMELALARLHLESLQSPPGSWGSWGLASQAGLMAARERLNRAEAMADRAAELHFPREPGRPVEEDSDVSNRLLDTGRTACCLETFAYGLHVFQDSFAHSGMPPMFENRLGHSRGPGNAELGWFSTLWPLADADKISNDPDKARRAAMATYSAMLRFRNVCPVLQGGDHHGSPSAHREPRTPNYGRILGLDPPPPATLGPSRNRG